MNNAKYLKKKKKKVLYSMSGTYINKYTQSLTITMNVSSLFTKDWAAIVSIWLQSKEEPHHWPPLTKRQHQQSSYGNSRRVFVIPIKGQAALVLLYFSWRWNVPAFLQRSVHLQNLQASLFAIDCREWKFSRQLTKLHSCHYQYFGMVKN